MIWLAICISTLEPLRLEPRDDAHLEEQFTTFRDSLIAAIKKGNFDWVNGRLDPNILWSCDLSQGKNAMLRAWRTYPEGLNGFYRELLKVVTRGGGWETYDRKRRFVAPYYVAFWPDSLDPFENYEVALEEQTPIYNRINGRPIGHISYEIVVVLDAQVPRRDWLKLGTSKGIAWSKQEYFESPLGYRACFEKVRGSFMLTVFTAGGCAPEIIAPDCGGGKLDGVCEQDEPLVTPMQKAVFRP